MWKNWYQNILTYDSNNNQKTFVAQNWENSVWKNGDSLHYYYSDFVNGIAETPDNFILTVFPNPSTGIFTLNLNNLPNATLSVTDALGHCLWRKDCKDKNTQQIDLSSQPKGIYFLEVNSQGQRSVKKISLQ